MFPLAKRRRSTEQAMLFTKLTLISRAKARFTLAALLGRKGGNDNRHNGFAAGGRHELMTIGHNPKQRGV
jgi:hypothetical protein